MASPKIPFRIPIDVIPICTVDKKLVGSSASLSAVLAPLSPSAACLAKRALRAVTMAISDIAKTPFNTIRPISIKNSITAKSITYVNMMLADLPPTCYHQLTSEKMHFVENISKQTTKR